MIKEQETKLSNIIKLEQKETYKDQEDPDFWKFKQKKENKNDNYFNELNIKICFLVLHFVFKSSTPIRRMNTEIKISWESWGKPILCI